MSVFTSGPIRLDHADIREPLPKPVQDAAKLSADEISRYPDPENSRLKDRFSEFTGVEPEMIRFTNGLEEAIEICVRNWTGKNLVFPPTFAQFARACERTGNSVVERPMLNNGHSIDINTEDLHHDIIWICRPNNPTGTLTSIEAVQKICRRSDGTVVVDEAYIDYTSAESAVSLLPDTDNLVVLRGFSKGFGLAGLRIGAILSSAENIEQIDKLIRPFTVNQVAQETATAALEHIDEFKDIWDQIILRGSAFSSAIQDLGWKAWPVNANFVLVEFPDSEVARRTHSKLEDNGIHTTPGWDAEIEFIGLPDRFIRFVTGSRKEMIAVLSLLDEITEGSKSGLETFLNAEKEEHP